MCSVFRKSACPFGQVKTEMYLLESPFSKDSLAGASGLVLMSVPALKDSIIPFHITHMLGGNFSQSRQKLSEYLR